MSGQPLTTLWSHLLAAVVFSVVGIVVFAACLFLTEKLTPFSLIKEIGEEIGALKSLVLYSTKEYKKERVKYFV